MKQQISVVSPRESMIMSQVIRSLADRVVCVPVFFNRTKLARVAVLGGRNRLRRE